MRCCGRVRVSYTSGVRDSRGKSAKAPEPKAVLGSDIEAKPDGSMFKLVSYPKAGYWVAYSRTAGDQPLTIITMQRSK